MQSQVPAAQASPDRSRAILLRRVAAGCVGVAAGAAFLYAALRGVNVVAVGDILARGHWGLPGLAVLCGVGLFIGCKARRWRLLLGDAQTTAPRELLRPVAIGLLLNALLAHTGEIARSIIVNRKYGLPIPTVLVSIAVERLFDVLAVLALATIAGAVTPVPGALAPPLRVLTALACAAGLVLAGCLWQPTRALSALKLSTRWLPSRGQVWVDRQFHQAFDGIEPLRAAHRLPAALLWSVAQWGTIVWSISWCGQVAGEPISPALAVLVMVGMVVVFILPNAPAYLGSTQIAFLAVLAPVGISRAGAIACSVVYLLLFIVPTMAAGAFALVVRPNTTRKCSES
jgi:glycosyltransferase 2 family protein